MTVRTVRRSAAALAVAATSAVFCVAASPAAPSPAPSAALPAGLYGTKDPTWDGVWRQSLAIIAQDTVHVVPSAEAVAWLAGQQCDNGGFASYRPDATKPCDSKTMFDTNATAAAVHALAAAGEHTDQVQKGIAWLKSVQSPDGGWSYNPGMASDANSTAIVIGAFAAAKERPGDLTSEQGKTPYNALVSFAIPCADKTAGGAFAYQPDAKTGKLLPNGDATAAAVLGGLGRGMVVQGPKPGKAPACVTTPRATPEQSARNGAAYLAKVLAKTGHLDSPPMPGATDPAPLPDFGNTADAVVALSAAGHKDKAAASVAWLEKNASAWAKEAGPAAYAQLILAAHAYGADPRDFGGADLVQQLNATGPTPASTVPPSPAAQGDGKDKIGGDRGALFWVVGAGLAAVLGAAFMINDRRKNRKQAKQDQQAQQEAAAGRQDEQQ
ncbi:prenyltransferase/squalene oxidase repeat-containing protein [Streptomyces sp. NPDC000410]|uniref:prenyltransferase/squalene oxidase repeat-containing protein n=1 Tax=Streptomyces sp. NPDC000410 TaxID=3154254 RepID=UPI00332E0DB5